MIFAAAWAAVLSANAVHAAPAGFVATLSATAIAGTAVHASAFIAATKTIAMIVSSDVLMQAIHASYT